MNKLRWLLLFYISVATICVCLAQVMTVVTGTVTDLNGNPYANGTVSAYSGSGPISYNGLTDANGTFSLPMPPNSYLFTICAPPVNLGPTTNPTPTKICFTSPVLPITGGTQDISGALSSASSQLGPVTNNGPPVTQTSTIAVTPPVIPFGSTKTGTSSFVHNFAITNTGNVRIVINSCTFTGTKFALVAATGCSNVALLPGAVLVPQVVFTPTAVATVTDTLTVNSTAPFDTGNPPTIALNGTGTGTVTFNFSINGGPSSGSGQVITDDSNIACNVTPPSNEDGACAIGYNTGSSITARAIANPGNIFTGFTGTGSASACTTSPCGPFTITADTILTANFAPIPQTGTLALLGGIGQGVGDAVSDINDTITGTPLSCHWVGGVVSGTKCNGIFPLGSNVTITETPSVGCVGGACTFGSFVGVNGCPTTPTTCVVPITGTSQLVLNFNPPTAGTALAPIQSPNKQQAGAAATITLPFPSAQSVGDAVYVHASWPNNTTTVTSISDTNANTYTQTPTISPATEAGVSSVIYCSILSSAASAGANTVTMNFSASTPFIEIASLEYAGINGCAPDSSNKGLALTGTVLDSGAATSTQPGDLLLAFNTVASSTILSGPSNGATWIAAIPATSFGNDAEHVLGVPTGAYHNLAHQSVSGVWISQIIAAKTQTVSNNTASLTIQCQGSGFSTFASTFGTPPLAGTCPGNGGPTGVFSTTVPIGQAGGINVIPGATSTFSFMQGGGCGVNPSCQTNPITINTTVLITTFPATVGCAGPFSITSQPGPLCPFYNNNPTNVTNHRLPADVMSHLAVNSDVMAVAAFNAGGQANGFTYPTNWASPGTDDNGNPLYYGGAGDPFYKLGAGCTQTTGIQNAPAFHARNNASFNDTHRSDSSSSFFSDANIRFFDTVTNILAGNYRANNSVTPVTIGNSTATSAANAVQVNGGGACGEAVNAFTDADWGSANGWVQRAGNEGSSGLAPMAGIIRGVELTAGQINHALILGLSCTDAYQGSFHVFPSPIDTAHCPVVNPANTNSPANGALLFCDYTDAQIAGMAGPNADQKTVITALCHYGGYIDVTTGGAAVGMIVFHDSPLPYQVQTGGTITQRTTGGGVTGMYVTGGTPDPVMAHLNGIWGCGGTSGTSDCKYGLTLWNNIPNVGGTDFTHHIHIADPCIAKGYANQPGACF